MQQFQLRSSCFSAIAFPTAVAARFEPVDSILSLDDAERLLLQFHH